VRLRGVATGTKGQFRHGHELVTSLLSSTDNAEVGGSIPPSPTHTAPLHGSGQVEWPSWHPKTSPPKRTGRFWGYHARPFPPKPQTLAGGRALPTGQIQRLSGRHGRVSVRGSGTVHENRNRGSQ
jgi:hypothetical protein